MTSESGSYANPTASLTLFFSVLVIMFWAMMLGYLKPEAALTVGVIQLALYPAWLWAAAMILKNGDGLAGNLFLFFGAFLAGCSGAANVVAYFAQLHGWPLDPKVMGYLWLLTAVVLLAAVVAYRVAGWVFWTLLLFADLGLFLFALTTLGVGPAATMIKVTAWVFLVVAVEGIYVAFVSYLALGGVRVSLGKPLFAVREKLSAAVGSEAH